MTKAADADDHEEDVDVPKVRRTKPGYKCVTLSDNTVLESAFENTKNNRIICVENLVYESETVGNSFEAAADFLWPFQLADSKSQFKRRTLKIKETGKDSD